MAKISHHGSCRLKYSTAPKKGNWWSAKCRTRQCQTDESINKTTLQKSPEDNQTTGLFTCESFTTKNPQFIKICHQMWGTGQDGRRRNLKKKNFKHKESLLSKEYPCVTVCTFWQSKDRYLKKETRPYIPNPQRCFQCQKFGHTKNSCKGKAVCAGCGEEGHNLDDCQNDPKGVNCQGNHGAISRDCPKWKIEKDIVALKYTEHIAFADARKLLQPCFDQSKDSCATVTQTPPQSSWPLSPWARKIRLPIDFKTEIEYLKYILNNCLTLDT